ncbi:hypothetical protein NPIL_23761 [Nephila pilipes]|uniref:Uncharacterized protein n=1 Tax=Nephila pilipes TaxID=299642 RepID=A0A8X6INZ6_NEPPI|nr:hypothetical protein NPIL_23761 [Nephila pilipes]
MDLYDIHRWVQSFQEGDLTLQDKKTGTLKSSSALTKGSKEFVDDTIQNEKCLTTLKLAESTHKMWRIFKRTELLGMVIKLHHNNFRSVIAIMTQQKIRIMTWDVVLQTPYSLDLAPSY